jgi:hypothetical protein
MMQNVASNAKNSRWGIVVPARGTNVTSRSNANLKPPMKPLPESNASE